MSTTFMLRPLIRQGQVCTDCPDGDRDICHTCFGTGFVGGYNDPQTLTIEDLQVEKDTPNLLESLGVVDDWRSLSFHLPLNTAPPLPNDLFYDTEQRPWKIIHVESEASDPYWNIQARLVFSYEAAYHLT